MNNSETPRTDAAQFDAYDGHPFSRGPLYRVSAEFARQLEIELTQALKELSEIKRNKIDGIKEK